MTRRLVAALVPVGLVVGMVGVLRSADPIQSDPAAVERAREQVRMLDDLYKTAVVGVTSTYVKTETDVAAATAFKGLFAAMKEKGWHEARLVDATGEPYEEKNAPADEFEKSAITQLKAGKPYVDQIIEKDGKPYLRAATAIPVVMDRCIMCHPHYKNAEKDEPIGALMYVIPVK